MSNTTRKVAAGAVVAGVVGYVAGILTAPKSGKETRKDIKDTAVKGWAEAEKQLKNLYTELAKKVDELKVIANDLSGKAKDEANDLMSKARDAKEKVREVLSAIHEGDADDADLQKAVKEANLALQHIKDYLKK